MELKYNKKTEIHYRCVLLFKKIIEKAIELEISEARENDEIYGYNIIYTSEFNFFFKYNSKFMTLMLNENIILKSKLKYHHIFFPMYILGNIINNGMINFTGTIAINYYSYLKNTEMTEEDWEDFEKNHIFYLEKMIDEPDEFWFNHSGSSDEVYLTHLFAQSAGKDDNLKFTNHSLKKMIFDFCDTQIEQYKFNNNKYVQTKKFIDIDESEIIRTKEYGSKNIVNLENEERYFLQLKESSKFNFEKKDLIEYTLQDILEYLNNQISIYHSLDKMNELNKELNSEVKSPKMVQKLLDNGLSIDEALESIGY